MRYFSLLLVALVLSGCGGDVTSRTPTNGLVPTGPPPPPDIPASAPTPVDTVSATATGWLWVMVIDASGVCIDRAVIEIVSGQGKGFKGTPSANCDAWDWNGGYFIFGLVPGDSLTLRASAPGYLDGEQTFFPSSAETQQASFITLSKQYGQPSIPLGNPTLDLRPSR